MMTSRATNAEIALRIAEVEKLILTGASRADIIQFVTNKYNVTVRQGDNYLKKARENIETSVEIKREFELAVAMRRLNSLYMSALKVQDLKTALAIQKDINNIHGLYAPQKQEVSATIANSFADLFTIADDDESDDEFA